MQEQPKSNGHAGEPAQIVPAGQTALAQPAHEETVEQRLARADKQIAYRKGILGLIAANIEPGDIAIYGEGEKETIHLTKTACKQILSWAGIAVQPDNQIQEKRYEGPEGPYIDFEVWATWLTPDGRYYRAMGNRSTYDDFFAKRTKYFCADCGADGKFRGQDFYCSKENKKVRWEKDSYYLPLTEVDIPAVKQAAITNLWNHIVEDAGLKPSKRELAAVGFDFSKVGQRVEFGGAKKEAAKQAPARDPGQATQGAAASAIPPTAKPPQTAQRPAAPAPQPSGPPKAEIPAAPAGMEPSTPEPAVAPAQGNIRTGTVKVAYLNRTKEKKNRYVKLVQAGRELFCFHDTNVETWDGTKNLLDLLTQSRGWECEFIVKVSEKGSKPMTVIEGARRIGPYQWDDDGTPVLQREPGDEPYRATDEDIPI